MVTCNPNTAEDVEVELLESNNHLETLRYANGLVYARYNEGRGPIIQMFCRIGRAMRATDLVLHQGLLQAVNRALADRGMATVRCERVELLSSFV